MKFKNNKYLKNKNVKPLMKKFSVIKNQKVHIAFQNTNLNNKQLIMKRKKTRNPVTKKKMNNLKMNRRQNNKKRATDRTYCVKYYIVHHQIL